MQEPEPMSRSAPGRSCVACKRRKIRCNRGNPCSYCIKQHLQCSYPDISNSEKERSTDDVASRLERIESILERLEVKVSNSSFASPQSTGAAPTGSVRCDDPSHSRSTHQHSSGKLVLDEGDGRYVTGSFWAGLDAAERKEAVCLEQQVSTPGSIQTVPTNAFPGDQGLPLGLNTESKDLRQLHPSRNVLTSLWQTYIEGVDPVLKMIHVPVTQRQLFWASQHPTEVPAAFESLMFAVYFAAVTSVQRPACCRDLFHEDRQILLRRYRFGFEAALGKANFMTHPNVTTVQALTLFLTCARFSTDKAYVWSMVGLLIRLAMKLGLHRDPVDLGLSPFMSEMRRRLWWQIYALDVRTAEDSDMEPFIGAHIYNTRFPTNINDVDLDVDMIRPASGTQHRTEMLFTLLRVEVSYAARKIVFSPHSTIGQEDYGRSSMERILLLQDLVTMLEEKYFKYCDPQVPICFLAETATRMVITKMKLTIIHPARTKSFELCPATLQVLVLHSIEIIEGVHILRTHDKYSCWVWLFETYVDWDAVAFLLHVMSAVPLSVPLERAWNVIDMFFQNWKDRVTDNERWRRLEKLRTKAAAGRNTNTRSPTIPQGDNLEPKNFGTSYEANGTDLPRLQTLGSEEHSILLPDAVSDKLPTAVTGDYVDWNFDNFLLTQEMPSWDMELDGTPFCYTG